MGNQHYIQDSTVNFASVGSSKDVDEVMNLICSEDVASLVEKEGLGSHAVQELMATRLKERLKMEDQNEIEDLAHHVTRAQRKQRQKGSYALLRIDETDMREMSK